MMRERPEGHSGNEELIRRRSSGARIDPLRREIFNQARKAGLLVGLSVRERSLLEMRFGDKASGKEPLTHDQLRGTFNVSAARISKLEEKALLKLKRLLKSVNPPVD